MDSKAPKNGSGVRKRPEIALYKPGMGKILPKYKDNNESIGVPQKSESSDDLKQDIQQKSETNSSATDPKPIDYKENKCNDNYNTTKGVTNKGITIKKPDIKVYVPPKLSSNSLDKNTEKSSNSRQKQRSNLQNNDKPNERKQQNSKTGNNRQKYERNERHDNRSERHERNDRQERTDRQDGNERHEKSERREKSLRHERNERHEKSVKYDRNERSDRYERTERTDRSERVERTDRHDRHERRDRHEKPERNERPERQTQIDQKNSERNSGEKFTKIKDNLDSLKPKTNELQEVSVNKEDLNRRSKQNEPKVGHNLTEKQSNSERYETYEDYYNIEFNPNVPKGDRSQRHNRNNSQNTDNTIARNDRNYTSNENKTRIKPENSKQRNYSSNKSHNNRYVNTFEQQIPPRFLKQQQLKKQNELSEQTQQTNYETQRRDSLRESTQQTLPLTADCVTHRGLIRLPANNQLNQNEWTAQPNTSQSHPNRPMNANANKPCVAIRPTQHVPTIDNPSQYSPSSSPDTNSLSTVDNYQQLSPYLRSNNYNEYAIPHFMSTASVENPENCRKKLKPIIEKSLSEATAAENDLHLCVGDPQKLEQIRYRIQLRFEHIILNDLRVCAELNIEQRLWKSAFYQFIEHFRRLMEQKSEQQSELKTSLHKIIDEASLFFENLLVKMQETYGFVIEKLLAHEYDSETENYDTLKLASISAQKIYLYLGDLSRYRECETKNSNFVKSKFFYLRAQMLAPKNGRSYNQLALLAMYQNRRLDAVYYYMRSLAASNPFLTARENLLAIFDEVRRKYELTEKKRKQDFINQNKRFKEMEGLGEGLTSDKTKERIEIWIRSDGTSAVFSNYKKLFKEESDVSKEDLDSLSSVDLNKRFVLSFLHTHGKLFSRVGMESFVPVVNQMLAEFRTLLRRSPIPVMSQRLSQLLAINMFAVFHTSLKDTSYGQNCRSLLQEQAIQVTLAMISLILECAIKSLTGIRVETNSDIIPDDLSELLPTIKLWTDWMSCQKQLWCPPPPPSDFKLDCRGDVWSIFAQFLTLLTKVNVRSVKLLGSKLEGCEPIILPEDTALAGFLPLLGSPQCVQFAQPNYDKEKARTCLRLTAIQYFGDYLCGIVEPYLKYDVENKRFVSLIPTSVPISSEERIDKSLNDLEINETENEDYSNEISSTDTNTSINTNDCIQSPEQMEIDKLWSLQEKLKEAKDRQDMIKQTVDAVLSEEKRKPSRIIIQPRYIIPDTNCYIDHLDKIKSIINCKYFDLIVPLIVINELNGLKTRGIKTTKPLTFTDDHIGNVAKAAMETIEYLDSAFNDKSLRLKAITSKGSLLDNIHFISESFGDSQGNSNDDFILNSCIHFIKDKPLDKTTKESSMTSSEESNSIFREVVLLTDDRNLRVKALGHNVPVKSLPLFIKWSNIPFKSNHKS